MENFEIFSILGDKKEIFHVPLSDIIRVIALYVSDDNHPQPGFSECHNNCSHPCHKGAVVKSKH